MRTPPVFKRAAVPSSQRPLPPIRWAYTVLCIATPNGIIYWLRFFFFMRIDIDCASVSFHMLFHKTIGNFPMVQYMHTVHICICACLVVKRGDCFGNPPVSIFVLFYNPSNKAAPRLFIYYKSPKTNVGNAHRIYTRV